MSTIPLRQLAVDTSDYEKFIVPDVWLECLYITAALLFILALRGLGQQETSKMGNLYGVAGFVTAIVGVLISPFLFGSGYWIFFTVSVPPAVISSGIAMKIKMTSMPQLVGLLNACGGLAATLEGFALFFSPYEVTRQNDMMGGGTPARYKQFQVYQSVFYLISAAVGMITFTGSLVACAKLSGHISSRARILPGRSFYTPLIIGGMLGFGALAGSFGLSDLPIGLFGLCMMTGLAAIYGVIFVLAIGGADMPIVISILNSGSGWGGVFAGLTLQNSLMILAGSFVGASGIILSHIMCQAMNRSLYNVLVGGFGNTESAPSIKYTGGTVNEVDVKKVAEAVAEAKRIIIVPGYGMAVSRAQHVVAELTNTLIDRGIHVSFGIHPVAGRLPGHMNVLLAEANIPYDIVYSLEEINDKFGEADIVFIIGANDTVNPAAEDDPSCAIYGMPVLKVWEARMTIVMKRSLSSGYAGVDNPLFLKQNNNMLLGDAKKKLSELLDAVRAQAAIKTSRDDAMVNQILHDSNLVKWEGDSHKDSIDNSGGSENMKNKNISFFIGILKETEVREKRVAVIPKLAFKIIEELNIGIIIESNAGKQAGFDDEEYKAAGCSVFPNRKDIYSKCTVIIKITCFTQDELEEINEAECEWRTIAICGFGNPANNLPVIDIAAKHSITLMSLDMLPRITTAQKMDILSSTAKLAGYRAVIEACNIYNRLISGEITAAGKYSPAKIFIIGAGVAGLQAIGDARKLGADVRAFDIRLECKEQVESMGAKYLVLDFSDQPSTSENGYAKPMGEQFLQKEMELFEIQAQECDIIITTASIPGRRAPILFKEKHVQLMKKNSVLVDLAAATGGNCEVTKPNEVYKYNDRVYIVGFTDLPSRMASHSSEMFSNNILHTLSHFVNDGEFKICMNDVITRQILLSHEGKILFPPPRLPAPEVKKQDVQVPSTEPIFAKKKNFRNHLFNTLFSKYRYCGIFNNMDLLLILCIACFTGLFATTAPPSFPPLLYVFTLGSYVGYLLVWNVAPALHTPLMSVSNAISGVVIVGGMLGISTYAYKELDEIANSAQCLQSSSPPFYCMKRGTASVILNALAIAVASTNVFGGFAVTQRMLSMFKRRSPSISS